MMRGRPQPIDARPQDLPTKAELARLRVEYEKGSRLAYLGHLDLISTIERCIRRSGLPFSLGNGFARRMRVQFSGALPVGASSRSEFFDLRLNERVDASEALDLLRSATPRALRPIRASYVPGRLSALEAWLNRSSWEVVCPDAPFGASELLRGIEAVRQIGTITYLRGEKEKRVDVRSCLVDAEAVDIQGGVRLVLETRQEGTGALRPAVLLDAAIANRGLDRPRSLRVTRMAQQHEEDGRLVEPFGPFDTEGLTPLS